MTENPMTGKIIKGGHHILVAYVFWHNMYQTWKNLSRVVNRLRYQDLKANFRVKWVNKKRLSHNDRQSSDPKLSLEYPSSIMVLPRLKITDSADSYDVEMWIIWWISGEIPLFFQVIFLFLTYSMTTMFQNNIFWHCHFLWSLT